MPDHTPAKLARIIAPLWEAVPEARPDYNDNDSGIHDTLCVKEWNRNIGLHWCLEGRGGSSVFISDGMARDLILARLQLAIEKRTRIFLAQDGTLATYTDDDFGESSHPDPLIARAVLLAQIVGVELGDAHA